MGFVQEADVRTLLQDQSLVGDIIKALVDDPGVVSELAGDVAGELEGVLEDDSDFRQKLLAGAASTPAFKQQILRKLLEEITD